MVIEQNAVYTVKEAAELLKMSEASMWRLVRSGELESVKLGKLRRIKGQALLSLLDKGTKKA
ncbi:MAG TPA: helix-turn-helix domain-containing protein [Desulfomonilia bacterium]|jgi:excisionase family DNA binding protein